MFLGFIGDFFLTTFISFGHEAALCKNAIVLSFGPGDNQVTLPLVDGLPLASPVTVQPGSKVTTNPHTHSKMAHQWIPLELLHNCLGHQSCQSLLATAQADCWHDANILMPPAEKGCPSCHISTILSSARNKLPATGGSCPGQCLYMIFFYLTLLLVYPH